MCMYVYYKLKDHLLTLHILITIWPCIVDIVLIRKLNPTCSVVTPLFSLLFFNVFVELHLANLKELLQIKYCPRIEK